MRKERDNFLGGTRWPVFLNEHVIQFIALKYIILKVISCLDVHSLIHEHRTSVKGEHGLHAYKKKCSNTCDLLLFYSN